MKKLLVGSVFATSDDTQQRWLDLQLRFLDATTYDYDHVAVVSDGPSDAFSGRTKVMVPDDLTLEASDAHVNGLSMLLNHFREKQDDYHNFLFLDGDAFPIRKSWLGSLLTRMEPAQVFDLNGIAMPSASGDRYEVAVVLRCENLESRLHASVLFAKKEALPHLSFEIGLVGNDLLAKPEEDVHIPAYQFDRRKLALPLLRSNQYNVHPLACGVYYDMFYHHSCGSGRWFNLRAKSYYGRIVKPVESIQPLTSQLFSNPTAFVSRLAGWTPSLYADVGG